MSEHEATEVRISQDFDGKFTVFSEHEPVFCFIRDSREEAVELARETVRDYRRRFGGPRPMPLASGGTLRMTTIQRSQRVDLEAI